MNSELPYSPAKAPPSKKWGWRDQLLVCTSMGLVYTVGEPFSMAAVSYRDGQFFSTTVWSLGGMITLALATALIIIALTHEASEGIRKFFRDRPNLLGLSLIVGTITSAGLTIQMAYLALMLKGSQSFVAVSYIGSAIFFGLLTVACVVGLIGFGFGLVGDVSKDYIAAARQGTPHDY